MNLLEKSSLINNIKHFNLDNRISKLELVLQGLNNRFGQRISNSKGHSSVVIDRRYYIYGDLIKDIDWKLTAKTDKLYTKIRESYKQSRIYLLVDNSESMSTKYNKQISKLEFSLLLSYIIASICIKEHDEVYIYLDNDFERVKKTSELLDILIKIELNNKTNIFEKTINLKKGYLYLFSDYFIDIRLISKFYSKLPNYNLRSGIIKDIEEESFNFNGINNFINPEDKNNSILSVAKYIKNKYLYDYKKHFSLLNDELKKLNLKYIYLYNNQDPVSEFLKVKIWYTFI